MPRSETLETTVAHSLARAKNIVWHGAQSNLDDDEHDDAGHALHGLREASWNYKLLEGRLHQPLYGVCETRWQTPEAIGMDLSSRLRAFIALRTSHQESNPATNRTSRPRARSSIDSSSGRHSQCDETPTPWASQKRNEDLPFIEAVAGRRR